MALHELAANAGKYGALSRDVGRVAITWLISDDGRQLLFSWKEQGGPAVAPPQRSGLGTLILTRLVEQSLEARVDLQFSAEGVAWRLTAPLEKVAESEPLAPL